MNRTAPLLAAAALLLVPIAAGAAPHTEKDIRFELPKGFVVEERYETEPGEEDDKLYVGRRGTVEVRAEVEDGLLDCEAELKGERRAAKTAAGRETCEIEAAGPPALGDQIVERRAAMVAVQFEGRHFTVIVFAPGASAAMSLARQVAASAVEARK